MDDEFLGMRDFTYHCYLFSVDVTLHWPVRPSHLMEFYVELGTLSGDSLFGFLVAGLGLHIRIY